MRSCATAVRDFPTPRHRLLIEPVAAQHEDSQAVYPVAHRQPKPRRRTATQKRRLPLIRPPRDRRVDGQRSQVVPRGQRDEFGLFVVRDVDHGVTKTCGAQFTIDEVRKFVGRKSMRSQKQATEAISERQFGIRQVFGMHTTSSAQETLPESVGAQVSAGLAIAECRSRDSARTVCAVLRWVREIRHPPNKGTHE